VDLYERVLELTEVMVNSSLKVQGRGQQLQYNDWICSISVLEFNKKSKVAIEQIDHNSVNPWQSH